MKHKNKVVVRGLITAGTKEEKRKFTTYLWLSYRNTHYQLNDPEVNDDNFSEIQRKYPEKIVAIRHFLLTIKVPIKKIHIRAVGTEPFTHANLNWYSDQEAREEDD